MKLRSATMVAAVLVTVITGCATTSAGPGHPATATANTPAADRPAADRPAADTLYTHCGIDEANIGGRWFEADHPLSDGNGNPPPGWGNPDQPGTIRILSATTAEFRDSLGHVVRFHLLAGATGPKRICA